MPKNPHPPRGGAGKKANQPVGATEDTSFIVFSNAKGGSKKAKQAETAPKPAADPKGKGKGKATPEASTTEEPKKPDVKTLIGGASWTGKLPVNMLSEHCQKQKWDKPDYSMHKTPEGFISEVTLSKTDPKSRERTVLSPSRLPQNHRHLGYQQSALEARHFAAAYALFRICNMKNIHVMMPPHYRDLWKGDFQDVKKQEESDGHGYLFEADPFQAKKEHDDAVAAAAKKREEIAKQKAKQEANPLPGMQTGGSSHGLKGWNRAPKIDMGKRTRTEVERLVRQYGAWNPHSVKLISSKRSKLVDEIVGMGFRQSHVQEAAEICKDREEILEWLLIHVPEDDLPKWALPEGYVAGISLASGNIQREAALKRLIAAGYGAELCEEVLDDCQNDEAMAAQALQDRLLGVSTDDLAKRLEHTTIASGLGDEADVWREELAVVESIYGERCRRIDKQVFQIDLEPVAGVGTKCVLSVRKPAGPYPNTLPIIAIHSDLPAYIRLSIIKRALLLANDTLLGEQMIFNLVDWLEQEIPGIVEAPGRLSDVSSGVAENPATARAQNGAADRKRLKPKPVSLRPGSVKSIQLFKDWERRQHTAAQQKMLAARRSLPAWQLQESIAQAVQNHQVVIISGETGSGKSTQSVQFVLDDMIKRQLGEAANIICTQPRRISALGLADRVADERCSAVGEEVGYIIRGESKQRQGVTRITFVTTGVLLRRLQMSGGQPEDVAAALADVSHVVVDEVHERSLDTDFLLVLLRDVLKRRKDLKVILMSATLDAAVFEEYFRSTGTVGRIEIQGRTYPVEDLDLEDVVRLIEFSAGNDEDEPDDLANEKSAAALLRAVGMKINYNLIAATVSYIDRQLGHQDGGILIFLPGTMEIDRTLQALRNIPNLHALPLHASLLPAEQRRVFPPAPRGKRKVIAATNVAETSITIEDVVAVIDTGRVKETSFDPATSMVKLAETWASRAACKQRRGRAGRVRAGNCYKLYTREAEAKMLERPDPEIRRVPLEQLCLSVRAMGVYDVPAFLASALTPPESTAVEGAISLLGRVGAFDGEELTALGRYLAMIPADLRCAKLMVYGATFGCFEACLTIAAILTVRSPFVSPPHVREESKAARSSFGKGHGDLLADLRAFEEWVSQRESTHPRELRRWCEQNYLSNQTLSDVLSNRSQYTSSLKEIGFIPATYHFSDPSAQAYNQYNGNDALIRALIAGSFNPQLARIDFPDKKFAASMSGAVALDPEARTIKYFSEGGERVFVHPGSTLFDAQGFPGSSVFMSYFSKMATSKVFIRDLTPFNVYSLLLFSGPIALDTLGRGLVVDGWVRLRGWARIGVLVSRLRMMLDDVLAEKIDDPSKSLAGNEVVNVVRKLVELDGLDR